MIHRGLIALLAVAMLFGQLPCNCDMNDGSTNPAVCCFGHTGGEMAPDSDTDMANDCQTGCCTIAALANPAAASSIVARPIFAAPLLPGPGRRTLPELHPPQASSHPIA